MKTVVITGATGGIGRSLVNVCIDAGYEVLAVVHRDSPRAAALDKLDHCHVLKLDLSEYGRAMEELDAQDIRLEGYELFFQLAWMAPFGKDRDNLKLQMDNVRAALDAVNFAKELGCTTFIGTGSQAEYGRVESILTPDTPTFPETGYGIAKLCAGQMTRLACGQRGLKHIWTRILSAYGPYDRDQTVISTAVINMMQDKQVDFTPCEQMWEFIYADDAARAIMLAGERGEGNRTYVVGSGEVHPLREYLEKIASITGYTKEIGFGRRPYNDKQVMYLQADIEEITKLGYRPQVTFEEGIRKIMIHRQGMT